MREDVTREVARIHSVVVGERSAKSVNAKYLRSVPGDVVVR
jgi:hypothetical protein